MENSKDADKSNDLPFLLKTLLDKQFVLSAICISLIFPSVLTGLLHWSNNSSNEKKANQERKETLLLEFSKSFSSFTSLAGDAYYRECSNVENVNKPIDDECKNDNLEKAINCQKLKSKIKILSLPQPESQLSLIEVYFSSSEVKKDAHLLFEKQKEIFRSLDCSIPKNEFDQLANSISEPYNNLISNMAKEIINQ